MTLQEIFAGCTAKPLLAEEPMAKHTSFRIGGAPPLFASMVCMGFKETEWRIF